MKRDIVRIRKAWPVSTDLYPYGGIGVAWESPGWGVGEWSMYWGSDGKLHLDTEYMDGGSDRSFSKHILNRLAELAVIDG